MSKKPDSQPPIVQQPIVQPPVVQPIIDELRGRQKPKEDTKAPPQGQSIRRSLPKNPLNWTRIPEAVTTRITPIRKPSFRRRPGR